MRREDRLTGLARPGIPKGDVPRDRRPRRLAHQKNVSGTIFVVVLLSTALSSHMSDETTPPILREIQREIAEIREDRAMMIESLDRLDAAVNSLSAEMKTLRSEFDRFR